MGETLCFIRHDHFPPFFSLGGIPTPLPRSRSVPEARGAPARDSVTRCGHLWSLPRSWQLQTDHIQLFQSSSSHGSTLHWANGYIFPPSRGAGSPADRALRQPHSISLPGGCGPPQPWSRSPSPRRGRWGGLCTQQAYLGLFLGPVVATL